MCVFLENGKWWYEFTIKGQRFRKSSRSTDKDVALLIESEHRRSLGVGTGGIFPTSQAIRPTEIEPGHAGEIPVQAYEPAGEVLSNRVVPAPSARPIPIADGLLQATEILLSQKLIKGRKPKTIESTKCQISALLRYFGDIPLNEITVGSFVAYQAERSKTACAETVNHETAVLKKILKKAIVVRDGMRSTLWEPIEEVYSPLRKPEWKPPKTFTVQEQQRIFDHANNDPNLELAQIVFTVTRNTTASGCELRGLRLRHLELNAKPPRVHIPPDSTKNNIRPRVIPLNDQALEAFEKAVLRAARLGSHRMEHYLFPFRVNRALWDPNRPASPSWLRKQAARLRKDTDIAHLRPHAFRHLAITEMLEQGAPEQTVIALAGWVGRKMIETYSHTRIEAKADVVKLLDRSGHKMPERPNKERHAQAPVPQTSPLPDIMHPAIQAEIARQVALALQQQQGYFAAAETTPTAKGPRLISFPSAR